tara:strand:+ start:319 stop:807 length:489 start_codon:yes stop_codon:yes gene_type:complete
MNFKYNSKQRNTSIQGLRLFKDTLPTKAKKIITKKGEIYSKTLDNWKYIVGEKLFKVCFPKSYRKSNIRGNCLIIMVKHGCQVDLEYSKQNIIDKINYFFGRNVVDNVSLKFFDDNNLVDQEIKSVNVTKNSFKDKISIIKNKEIKNSLLKLDKLFSKNEKN